MVYDEVRRCANDKSEKWEVGQQVVAYFAEDGQWYNAEITKVIPHEHHHRTKEEKGGQGDKKAK